jgi:MFS family permease
MSISAKAALKRTEAHTSEEQPSHLRRNFGLGIISGIAYNLYVAVLSTELVMTWFLSQLTDSNLLISLLIPIELGTWYFLQLLLSGQVQRRPRALPIYRVMSVMRLLSLALLVVATLSLDSPGALLLVFLATFTVNSVAAGVSALPFLSVVAKTIPPRRRGMYFGWRRFLGGSLGLLGGLLVRAVLSPDSGLAFPHNYGLLFFLGLVITAVLVGSFSLIVEPTEDVNKEHIKLSEQLRRAVRLPAQDRNYGAYLRVRLAIIATSSALPFYAVFARRELNAPQEMVGVYLICSTGAAVLSNLVLGQVGDRRGNRTLIRLAALTAILPAAMALLVFRMPETEIDKSLIFGLVFVFLGLHATASGIGNINYVLELAPTSKRAIYIGFANGVVGLALFASPLAGAVVDWLGFVPLFLFVLACGLIAVMLSLRLEEPRKRVAVPVEGV